MTKKIIASVIWVLYSCFYIYIFGDIGRATGSSIKNAVSDDVWIPWDLTIKSLKTDYTGLAILTVILVLLTVICYNIVVNKTKK